MNLPRSLTRPLAVAGLATALAGAAVVGTAGPAGALCSNCPPSDCQIYTEEYNSTKAARDALAFDEYAYNYLSMQMLKYRALMIWYC